MPARRSCLAALDVIERDTKSVVAQIGQSSTAETTATLCDRLNDLDTGKLLVTDLLARVGLSTTL